MRRLYLPSSQALALLVFVCIGELLPGQEAFNRAPINYESANPTDAISGLQRKIDSQKTQLKFDNRFGYLPDLLDELEISPSSQLLVYSKTSLQLHRISPRTPRAIYFNDDVYVGFIPGSDRLEISTADPALGGVFYVLKQNEVASPRFERDRGTCLACHANRRTQDVPGHLMRSVYPAPSGQPHYGMGTFVTTQNSPLEERWGGWFVNGSHGKLRHMGNLLVEKHDDPVDRDQGANLQGLKDRLDVKRYLEPQSDLVAMMVLTHQAEMHNLITLVNFQTRQALHQGNAMNQALGREKGFVSDSTRRRIDNAVEKMMRYLLFADEVKLSDSIQGSSEFKSYFESLGPFDKQGRSLRQFDLKTRTFKYPCSYLIYSQSFRQLPAMAREQVFRRLWQILHGTKDAGYESLTADDRSAILDILRETLPDLPKS